MSCFLQAKLAALPMTLAVTSPFPACTLSRGRTQCSLLSTAAFAPGISRMICISIANASHRWALVDMHNAAPQCDLLELRLDRLDSTPNVDLLLTYKTKPILA